MPRPKPLFSDFQHLFNGLNFKVVEGNFNVNSKITIICDHGHEYITSITKIKSLNHDYKKCPHCKKENKYNELRISKEYIEQFLNGTSYKIHNEKDFYKKWDDKIELKCINDGCITEIKSINWWIESGNKIPKCIECMKIKVLSEEEYKKQIDRITKNEIFIVDPPTPVYKQEITERALNHINSKNWYIKEYNGTTKKSKFICKTCGFEKNSNVFSLNACINCTKNNMKNGVRNKLKEICENSNIFIDQQVIYENVNNKIKFKCNTCGCQFSNSWSEITGKYYNLHCPDCYSASKRKSQSEISNFIKQIYNGVFLDNDRDIISPYELDIYLPDKKIAIEYCGNIWHSEKFKKDKNYHFNKYKMCLEKGIQLITIFEDEWKLKQDICKNRISCLIHNISEKIYARKCLVEEIDKEIANKFLDENHLQGQCAADVHYGLVYNGQLVSLMSFRNMENSKKIQDWELVRFVNIKNKMIIGSASKLLHKFTNTYKNIKLSTFSDNRWCNGSFYLNIGFKFDYDIDPGYYYVGSYTKWKLKHRFTFKKERLLEIFKNSDPNKSEHDIALENGLYRIYDCGHKKYTMDIP